MVITPSDTAHLNHFVQRVVRYRLAVGMASLLIVMFDRCVNVIDDVIGGNLRLGSI
jgi:hypothetical protein